MNTKKKENPVNSDTQEIPSVSTIAEAAACEKVFAGYVETLTADPATYTNTPELCANLLEQLDLLLQHQLPLDHLKRALAYGEKNRMPEASEPYRVYELGTGREVKIPAHNLLLVHHLLGVITEAFELVPFLKDLIMGIELDDQKTVELMRELGDGLFYGTGAASALGASMSAIRAAVMVKLAKRYRDLTFTQQAAVHRDEAAEH